MTKVSIIIPVYNLEKYLPECIDSVINQTYPDLEIIAVNDGSTDGSLKILKKYSDKLNIISKENGGISSALNAGIKVATGEWIKRLDCDDVLYPTAIEELILEANKLKDKKHTILYANHDYIDSDGKIIGQKIEPNYNQLDSFDFNVILLDHCIGHQDTTLIHKSTIEEYGMYEETASSAEDYEMWLRFCLLHNCRLHLIQKTIAKYRIHTNSVSRNKLKRFSGKGKQIRELTLTKLNEGQRKKYEIALKQYKNSIPKSEKARRLVRNFLVQILPNPILRGLSYYYWVKRGKSS